MTRNDSTFETLKLHVERREGWLQRLLAAVEGVGYCLDTLVLRRPAARSMNVTLTLRALGAGAESTALFLALQGLPGIKRSGLSRAPQTGGTVTTPTLGREKLVRIQNLPDSALARAALR